MQEERRTYYSYLHDAVITERRQRYIPKAVNLDELNLAEKIGYFGSFLGMSVVFLIHPVIGIIVTGISITTLIAGSIYRNF